MKTHRELIGKARHAPMHKAGKEHLRQNVHKCGNISNESQERAGVVADRNAKKAWCAALLNTVTLPYQEGSAPGAHNGPLHEGT